MRTVRQLDNVSDDLNQLNLIEWMHSAVLRVRLGVRQPPHVSMASS